MRKIRTLSEPRVLTARELDDLAGKLRRFCAENPVVLLYLHGAHGSGRQGPLSDLDVAVLMDRSVSLDHRAYLDLIGSLEQISGREDVDLVVLNTAGPIITDRVVRHGRLIYARSERERVLFEAQAIKTGLDFLHFSRAYDDALFRQLREGRFLD